MKKMLLLLLALIVVPAWAAEAPVAASPQEASAQAAQAAPQHKAKKAAKHQAKKTEPAAAAAPVGCAAGCNLMNCPPPGGDPACCHKTTSGYAPC